jgi:hypothetical protein
MSWWCLLLFLAGCGGADELNSPTAVKLKGLGVLYLDFAANRSGAGPADEKEFKRHIRGLPDHVLSGNGLNPKDMDGAFVSARDQQPFVVRYGTPVTEISGKSAPLIAHEKTGKDGKRLVGFANGKAEHVTEERLKELLADPN